MLLELKNITVHYDKVEAVKGVSLDVGEGDIVTLQEQWVEKDTNDICEENPYNLEVCFVNYRWELIYFKLNENGIKMPTLCLSLSDFRDYSFGLCIEIWNDIDTRQKTMHQIEEVECFANCTQLCKPHESNKAFWNIGCEYGNCKTPGEKKCFEEKLVQLSIEVSEDIEHTEFI